MFETSMDMVRIGGLVDFLILISEPVFDLLF